MRNSITFKVTGKYALFTDPITKIGGEKSTLMLPTYQALKGICESIYWKPSIIWYVDKVKVINKIQTESKGIRPIKYNGGNDLSRYLYLTDVSYIVQAHFDFNYNRPELEKDHNENKHYYIAKRSLNKGGRRDVFLGTRECQAYVEPINFDDEKSCYNDMEEMEFGLHYHSISYPDENGKNKLITKFWYPKMVRGVITFCRPDDCPKEVVIREMKQKMFDEKNHVGLNELEILEGYNFEEVNNELDKNFI
ncbi:MAG: type I-C CRISPR-associated protein Cas5c [Bacilli bacterium]|nr:type I-C CRISPR-associated protein Cas5c [Bacilli bacterium]MDD4795434.1 type I-C CRISPR-associated protein Cas5c [Bacilli bacterium]